MLPLGRNTADMHTELGEQAHRLLIQLKQASPLSRFAPQEGLAATRDIDELRDRVQTVANDTPGQALGCLY